MPSSKSLGWATALAGLGQAVPNILRQYNQDATAFNDTVRKNRVKTEAEEILNSLPEYGSVLEAMTPEEAQGVLARTSPQEKQAAVDIMAGKRGLDTMRLQVPASIPEPAMPDGGALGALAAPKSGRHARNAFVNKFMDTLGKIESDGKDIGAHPRAKNGAQAFGRFGVVPEFHAHRAGLDPTNPADLAKFKADPELQRSAAESFVRELGKKYNWDPVMMRRGYYGLTADNDAPQFLADGRRMPSSNEDNARFMELFGDMERPADDPAEDYMPAPYDNTLLTSMVKDGPPKREKTVKKVTHGDRLALALSKATNPEVYANLKDQIERISKMAEIERQEGKDREASFEKEQERYGENARKLTDLNFQTWKEQGERQHRARTYKDQSIQALRTQRDSLQKQLADIRGFQTRVAKGEESADMLAAAYPNFFTTKSTDPGFFAELFQGDDAAPGKETAFDTKRFTDAVKALEDDIQAIDQALSSKSGASVTPAAAPPSAVSKYLTPRKN